MERVLTSEAKAHVGKRAAFAGWVHRVRKMKGFSFLVLRDRAGLLQCVVDDAVVPDPLALRHETCVELVGTVREDARAPRGAELAVEEMRVVAPCLEERPPFELNLKDHKVTAALDVVLEHRAVSLRNVRLGAVFRIQNEIVWAFRTYLREHGFTEIRTPKIVASGTEGGTALFRVEYFEREAFLAQSPQFYKQMLVGAGYERVFETGFVYRAEEHNTTRHLNEYYSLDFEMGFIRDEHDVMDMESELLAFVFDHLRESCGEWLALFGAVPPRVEGPIPRLRLDEARRILADRYGKRYPEGADLDPEGERLISRYAEEELGTELVFLTHYPVAKRPMYTMPDPDDPTLTRSFDLIYKGLEITTGGQRIHDHDQLAESIRARGLDPRDFEFYLEIFRYGMPPHGGLAIGLERITAQLLGLGNVREAAFFPRDRTRITP